VVLIGHLHGICRRRLSALIDEFSLRLNLFFRFTAKLSGGNAGAGCFIVNGRAVQ